MPKIAAPTSSFRTPKMSRPSNFVSSTTTSSGTTKILPTVSAFGRFTLARFYQKHRIADCHESHPARRRQRYAAATIDGPHAKADRSDPEPAVSVLPDRSPQADPGDRRGDSQPQLPAAPHRGDFRRR